MNLINICDNWNGEEFNKRKNFIETYEEKFSKLKNKKDLRILELGIDGGGSLQLWEQYFPNASLILGVDIDLGLCRVEQNQKIRLIEGDLSKLETYNNIKMYGGFDLIIDDGSHQADDIIIAFGNLFPILKEDGYYSIENLYYTGTGDRNNSNLKNYMINLMLTTNGIIDCQDDPSYLTELSWWIRSIHFEKELCIIHKKMWEFEPSIRI
jgi:SAM-dependent methyltransferase